MFVLFVVFIVGAAVMQALEQPLEQANNAEKLALYANYSDAIDTLAQINATLAIRLRPLLARNPDLQITDNWNFGGSLLYWFTVASTIGYGTYTPQSSGGRAFTAVFGVFSIAYFAYCLSKAGPGLEQVLIRTLRLGKELPKDAVGKRAMLWLCVVVCWICAYAGLAEYILYGQGQVELDYATTLYFSVITFTTVGFGDFAPLGEGVSAFAFMILTFFGVVLLAMLVSAITDAASMARKHVISRVASRASRKFSTSFQHVQQHPTIHVHAIEIQQQQQQQHVGVYKGGREGTTATTTETTTTII